MWAIYIEEVEDGALYHPLGNDGAFKLNNKTRRGWHNEIKRVWYNRPGNAYIISNLNPLPGEISVQKYCEYVIRHSICMFNCE